MIDENLKNALLVMGIKTDENTKNQDLPKLLKAHNKILKSQDVLNEAKTEGPSGDDPDVDATKPVTPEPEKPATPEPEKPATPTKPEKPTPAKPPVVPPKLDTKTVEPEKKSMFGKMFGQ